MQILVLFVICIIFPVLGWNSAPCAYWGLLCHGALTASCVYPKSKFNTHLKCFKMIKLIIWKVSCVYCLSTSLSCDFLFQNRSNALLSLLCNTLKIVGSLCKQRLYEDHILKCFLGFPLDWFIFLKSLPCFLPVSSVENLACFDYFGEFYKHSDPLWNHVSERRK